MISHLRGNIIHKGSDSAVIDVHGIGYKVFLSQLSLSKLPQINKRVNLFCYLCVRENELALYGFLTRQELELFEIIHNISGIGPKVAQRLAGFGSLEKLHQALTKEDFKIPGVGAKRMQQLLLEVGAKLKKPASRGGSEAAPKEAKGKLDDPAFDALVNLGFSKVRSREALKNVPPHIATTGQRVKVALQFLAKS